MGSSDIRNGKGHRAFRRKAAALRRRAEREGIPCSRCGEAILFDAPATHPRSFTADHPVPLSAGGDLVRQELVVMCRSCNARKGDSMPAVVWAAT